MASQPDSTIAAEEASKQEALSASSDEQQEAAAPGKGSWRTIKPDPERKRPFATQIAVSFALISIMTATVLVLVLGFVWEGQFQEYTRQNMQRLAQSTAERLSAHYIEEGGWTEDMLSAASSASNISPDIGVQVIDDDGNIIFDDTWANAATAEGAQGATVAPSELAPTSADSVVTASVTNAEGEQVGLVRLWAFGSEALLTKSDAAFRTSSYKAIIIAALVASALATVIGLFTARSLVQPIRRITLTAAQIRNGDLTARTGLTGENEIGRLGEVFDDMATTIERDLDREHRLTSDVAHELRTPLMSLQVNIEAMQDGIYPCDEEHLDTVAMQVVHLSKIVDAMLRLSRIENGTVELKIERTDLVKLASNLVTAQHQMFHEKGLHLRFDDKTNHGECWAEVDPDLIREAVTNLMSNAMRYTNEGGWVVVSVAHRRGEATITVTDTGIGIAKEDIPRTFSRFWRSDVSRERVSGGLGVGLSLTKEIVDRHNGVITVDSELGKGSAFTLRLPTHRGGSLLPLPAPEA